LSLKFGEERPVINQQIQQFPIVYANSHRIGRVAVGWGCHTTAGNEAKNLSIKKALITTTGLGESGIVDEIKSILVNAGISVEIYDKVTSNPKDWQIMEAYQVFKDSQCDGVVSVGGGSSHDCGKALRIVACNGGTHISEFAVHINPPWMLQMAKYKPVTIPQLSVNTTAGTGAENSGGAAYTNTKKRVKENAMVTGMTAAMSLNDPLLVRMQPANVAAQCAYDAFSHAFEMFLSRVPSQFSQAMGYRAVKLFSENVREFTYNRMNHKAAENITWVGTMAGSFGLAGGAGVGIVHGLGHGLSALFDCHHGLANMLLTIPMERYNQGSSLEKFAELAQAMGVDTRNLSKLQASDKWFDEVERLLKDLNVQTGNLARRFGMTKEDCAHIVKNQYDNDFCMQGNPRDYNYEETLALLQSQL
jgi:alcohol dehydrogenase class IV